MISQRSTVHWCGDIRCCEFRDTPKPSNRTACETTRATCAGHVNGRAALSCRGLVFSKWTVGGGQGCDFLRQLCACTPTRYTSHILFPDGNERVFLFYLFLALPRICLHVMRHYDVFVFHAQSRENIDSRGLSPPSAPF